MKASVIPAVRAKGRGNDPMNLISIQASAYSSR